MLLEQSLSACFEQAQDNCYTYRIDSALPVFKGHFPDNPLLPGVCQLGLCADAVSRQLRRSVEIDTVSRCKFMAPIRPGQSIEVVLVSRTEGKILAELRLADSQIKVSQLIFTVRDRV